MSASFLRLNVEGAWVLTTPSAGEPLPVYIAEAPVGGGIQWSPPVAVPVQAGPTSTNLVAANAGRKAISIWSPVGNAAMSVDISGEVVTLAGGRPLTAGVPLDLYGAACPVGAITFIGTAGQSLVYQEGQ